jgi:hypothetical protein
MANLSISVEVINEAATASKLLLESVPARSERNILISFVDDRSFVEKLMSHSPVALGFCSFLFFFYCTQ